MSTEDMNTFRSLGLAEPLCIACDSLNWKSPTQIQQETIPLALQERDIIGLAETGSGKTGSFALPVLHYLIQNPQSNFCLVLTPTRELAFQISDQFTALGSSIGVKSSVIVGGVNMVEQAIALAKGSHIIVATPGRLLDHLETTKGFHLRNLRFLVLDEVDRMLTVDFEEALNKILGLIPTNRRTYLFSATMTDKVAKLQRASLQNPVKIQCSKKYQTVAKLVQNYMFIPAKRKDVSLVWLLNEFTKRSVIVFTSTCNSSQRLSILLHHLGFPAVPLHGQLSQQRRLTAFNRFKSLSSAILIATDVASRGLDLPFVDLVVNYDVPAHSKDYIHRVGRTARAGRSGRSVTFVSQYDVECFQRIEQLIDKKMESYPFENEEILVLQERVNEAQRFALMELKEFENKKKESSKFTKSNKNKKIKLS